MRIKDSNIILDDYDLEKFFRMDHIRDNLINNILKLQSREVKWEDIKIIIPKDFKVLDIPVEREK